MIAPIGARDDRGPAASSARARPDPRQ